MIDPNPLIRAIRPVVDAVGATFIPAAEAEASDVPIVWDGRTIVAVRMPPLHGALDRLIDAVEAELGAPSPVAVARGQAACGPAARRARCVHPAPRGGGCRRRDGRQPDHGLQLPERHPPLSSPAEPTVPSADGRRIDDFDVVAFDADDTLWRSEDSFESAERRFVELVAPYAPDGVDVYAALRATEKADVPVTGYGVKAFTLSMIQAAITVTNETIPSAVVGELGEIGRSMLVEPVQLLDHVPEVLAEVAAVCRVVLITKGDLVHQTRKVTTSGIAHHFADLEIVLEKDAEVYAKLLQRFDVPAQRFCMVGNCVRSDILPVLALGGHAVHIPYHLTWELEHVDDHDEDVVELASIADLPAWLGLR